MLRLLCFALLGLSLAESSLHSGRGTAAGQIKARSEYDDRDAYDAYAAILPKEWMMHGKPAIVLVLDETYPVKMCLEPEADSQKLIGAAIADYNKKNEQVWSLQRKISSAQPYALVSQPILEGRAPANWDVLRYPDSGGYFLLSALGFNPQKTIAIVWQEHRCGGLCGFGEFHVLQKKTPGEWEPLKWQGSSCSVLY